MSICTWKNCTNQALHPQLDATGRAWAHLCQDHHDELEAAIALKHPKNLLRAWIKAQGGAEKAAKRCR